MTKKFKEIKVPKKIMERYLCSVEGRTIKLLQYKRLGSGWHGTGYEMVYRAGKKQKSVILRTLRPGSFSHDFVGDRAKVFILQNELADNMPKHVESIDVGAYTKKGKLISIGEAAEFFQIVEKAHGTPYMENLERIKKEKKLKKKDRVKALKLSNYLVSLHRKKYKGSKELLESMKKRHLRDAIGHGEMLMGVLDTYPPKQAWIKKGEVEDIICKAVLYAAKVKENKSPLCRMHGDFHPGNILFLKNGEFELLDASRFLFGYAADDVTTLAINYIWFALMERGKFDGPFKELFDIFWSNYLRKTKDRSVNILAPLFFAFRGAVVAHPIFYGDQSNVTRRKIFNFIRNILKSKKFDPKRINKYLKG